MVFVDHSLAVHELDVQLNVDFSIFQYRFNTGECIISPLVSLVVRIDNENVFIWIDWLWGWGSVGNRKKRKKTHSHNKLI